MEIARLEQTLAESLARIDQLDTALRLMRVDHRLAHLTVTDQATDPDTGETLTRLQFQEVNDQGDPIDEPRFFTIKGDVVYVDYWVVKFEDQYVEQADLDRNTSICLFRRIYGEFQNPRDGYTLDPTGERPAAYGRGAEVSDFERKIWDDFWNIANDPEKAAAMGIRAAHGEAPFTQVRKGKRYTLQLRASGGLTITPGEDVDLRSSLTQ